MANTYNDLQKNLYSLFFHMHSFEIKVSFLVCLVRLRDFNVGVTNTSVDTSAPDPTGPNYDVCAYHAGKYIV